MGYEKNYLLLLLAIAVLFFFLDIALSLQIIELDLGFWVPGLVLLFGLVGAFIYARTGNWAFFFIAGVIIVAGVVNFFEITGGWSAAPFVSTIAFLAAIFMGVLRLMHKAAKG